MRPEVEQFITAQGTRIYRIPLSLFPEMHGFAHLIVQDGAISLFDVGSGFGESNQELEAGIDQIATSYGENVTWEGISRIFISHGHIDHFGGLRFVRERTDAPIVIHELERKVLSDYEGRLELIADRLNAYLITAGLPETDRDEIMTLYLLHKQLFSSIEVQETFEGIGMRFGPMQFEHVPGHCPGQVVAWVDDILLSSDHILQVTSPHQAPESLSLSMGLDHYLDSLAQILPRAHLATWTLGGHEGPIKDLPERIIEIAGVHRERLLEILGFLEEPQTLFEITRKLFPETEGYHRLLAIEEAGAHVEYLQLRGYLSMMQDDLGIRHYHRKETIDPNLPGFKRFQRSSQVMEQAISSSSP